MSFSAAELQRRHELEGAPDPFPAIPEASSAKHKPSKPIELDTESEVAFPSLAPSVPAVPAPQVWGASATGPRIRPNVKQNIYTDSFTLPTIDLSAAGKDGKTTTLGDVMRLITTKYKVKLDASGNQKTRQTTFYLKAESTKELEKAKRNLLSLFSPLVTIVLQAPASTIPSIIGSKGSTLKQIRDQTNVKIDIPKKETLTPNGSHPNGITSGNVTPSQDEEEPTIPVTLTGPQPLVFEAQALLKEIIATKTSIITQRVRDIPAHIVPFVRAHRHTFVAAAQGAEVQLGLNEAEREVTVHGDREIVRQVVDTVKAKVEGFKEVLESVKLSIPKQKHRLLVGKVADEILVKSKCFAAVPRFDDPAEEITVWGQPTDLPSGLSSVMEQANSKYIHEFPLPPATSRQLLTYMVRIHFAKTLMDIKPGVSVYLPSASMIEKGQNLNIVLTGDKHEVESTIREISGMLGKLTGATKEVSIDWLLQRIIMGKNAKKIKQFHDVHNVQVLFPPESSEQSTLLLVYDPQSPSASPSPDDKKKHLEDVEKELLRMEKEAADVDSQFVPVEKRWHEAVLGPNGSTLNAIIGEDRTLSIKVGADAGNSNTDDVILVRGIRSEVSRVVKDILKIVEDAKNDVIVSSHVVEFEVEKEYVGRVVGAQGASINRIREQLAVKIDVIDETEDKEKEGGKKRKMFHQKSKFKIIGRKENAEEAKKRILAQVERFADETLEILKISNQYHSSLIGQNGKYAIRLEEKYGVKITFPRSFSESSEGKTREQLKPDEVLVKGGKKGVANAKAELLDAYEVEKELNVVLKFTIPTRAVARVLGKNGASINEIKDNTVTQIDIDKFGEDDVTTVSVRGTKEAIADAKEAILAIARQVKEEVTTTVTVENKYHRSIIGVGGQGLRDLVIRCGGPADPKQQAGLIRFPRQGDISDEVKIRGEPEIVAKLQQELESIVASLRDRIILGVQVPAAQHRALIGRGGQHLNELQSKSGAQVQFPGSRSYYQVGEPENAAELTDVDSADLVKVTGPRDACTIAIELLKSQVKSPSVEVIDTIMVPLKYHHAISQQGAFYRKLRSIGVQVEQSIQPFQPAVPAKPLSIPSERIDDTQATSGTEPQWEVIPNYQQSEEGDSTWTLKARDQESIERAKGMILDGIQHAEGMSHVGFLTLLDRAIFPRIVGVKGANVARLREDTGADITVSREDTTIVIIGSQSSIEIARQAILDIALNTGRSQRRK